MKHYGSVYVHVHSDVRIMLFVVTRQRTKFIREARFSECLGTSLGMGVYPLHVGVGREMCCNISEGKRDKARRKYSIQTLVKTSVLFCKVTTILRQAIVQDMGDRTTQL